MNQCVPSWDIEDPPIAGNKPSHNGSPQSSTSVKPRISMPEHEVAELTWENGHLAEHGLVKPTPRYPASVVAGTLECIVDQAKLLNSQLPVAIDALVPTQQRRQREGIASGIGSCNNVGNSNEKTKKARLVDNNTVTTVGSRDDTACDTDDFGFTTTYSVSPVLDSNGGGGSPDTANASFNGGGSSRQLTIVEDDSFWHSRRSQSQMEMCGDEDEKVTEGGTVRSTISTKRSRAAAIHNQSERKRRDKINQKMRTLQKLVPNSSKTDKASMLDEVIDYLKQLQAQVTMMSRMGTLGGMPSMMMPMGMQQFQMAMMAQMAQMAQMTQMAQMGIGMRGPPQMAQMGLGMMDMSALSRAGPPTGTSPVLPASPFMPMNCASAWDPSVDRMQQTAGAVTPDPFSAFVACPPQQHMTMDAHQRMAAMYQQQMFQQNQPTNLKK